MPAGPLQHAQGNTWAMPALAPYDPVLRYPEGKFYLTFFFSIGKVIIHIQLFPCIWVSLELVIQDTEKENSLLLPTLKLLLLAHANKGGRVFSSTPPPPSPPEGGLGLRSIFLPFTQQLMLQPATCTSSSSPALQCQVLVGARFGARLSCPARS